MKERPILFGAPMVRALLDCSKTQTRRVAKAAALGDGTEYRDDDGWPLTCDKDGNQERRAGCPYGRLGDRLWVRETLKVQLNDRQLIERYIYAADGTKIPRCPDLLPQFGDQMAFAHLARRGGVPSIHMPRWATRITLEVTGVRVERLQDISEADAIAEGVEQVQPGWWRFYGRGTAGSDMCRPARPAYASLWESINGPGSWAANPWVWVVDFKRLER